MNCVIIDDDPIQHTILEGYIDELENLNCLGSFSNPIEFLKMENKSNIDFIILDMEMPKMSGLDLLEALQEPISILVISSKSQYAIDVINHNVLGYLLKPVKFVDFMKTIEKIRTIIPRQTPSFEEDKNYLFIKSNGMLHKLNYNDVIYIGAAVDYIEVFTKEKKYLVNSTMNKTTEKLPENQFFRIHRSTIININHINKIDRDFVEIGDESLKIAPSKKDKFLKFINSL